MRVDERGNVIIEYRGWTITAYHQIRIRPFLDFVAIARREHNGGITGFNAEGNTLEQAIEAVKRKCDQRAEPTDPKPAKGEA